MRKSKYPTNKTSISSLSSPKTVRAILCIVILTFCLPMISSWEFDNCKEYDPETRTVTIKNAFCLGDTLAKITLMSPNNVHVAAGEERLVAWYYLENYQTYAGTNVLGIVETFDLKRGNSQIYKNFVYKWQKEEEAERTVCTETAEYHANGSIILECEEEEYTVHEWKTLAHEEVLPPVNYTVGLFTEVEDNERVEWIPEMYGVEIDEWAIWESGLNEEIFSYYTMNESAGNERDWVNGHNNITVFNGQVGRGEDGIINGSANMTYLPVGSYFETNQMTGFDNIENGTVAFWVNFTTIPTNPSINYVLWGLYDTSDKNDYLIVEFQLTNVVREIQATLVEGGALQWKVTTVADILDFNPPRGEWSYFAIRQNGTDVEMFINGSSIWNNSAYDDQTDKRAWFDDVIGGGGDVMTWGANRTNNANSPNWNGSIDEIGIWNRSLTEDEIFTLYNGGAGIAYNPVGGIAVSLGIPIENYNTTSQQIIFNATVIPARVILTNATLYVYNSSSIFSNALINFFSGENANSTENFTLPDIPFGEYTWNVWGCGNDSALGTSVCDFASANRSFRQGYIINSIDYNATTYELSTEGFAINISYNSNENGISAILIHNGTNYGGIQSGTGDNAVFTRNINIPNVNAVTNISFYWNLTFTDGGTTTISTDWYNQTVKKFGIDDCSLYSFMIFNFTLRDEETKDEMNGGLFNSSVEIDLLISNPIDINSNITYFSNFSEDTNVTICLENYTYGLRTDATIKYDADDYVVEHYYLENYILENVSSKKPNQLGLYDLRTEDATSYLLTYQDCNYLHGEGKIIETWRRYVEDGNYLLVEMTKTNQDGQGVAHLVSEDIEYRFLVLDEGAIEWTTQSFFALCITTPCEISILQECDIDDFIDYTVEEDFTYTLTLTESTRTVELFYTIPSGASADVNMTITTLDYLMNDTIYSNQQTSAGGTMSYTIPSTLSNRTYYVEVTKDTNFITDSYFNLFLSPVTEIGVWGVLLSGFLVLSFGLMFMATGWGVVVGAVLGLIVSSILSLIVFSWTMLIWLCIAMAIIVYKISKKVGSG